MRVGDALILKRYTLRIVPPSLSGRYAKAHDQAILDCFCSLIASENLAEEALARNIATLPTSLGGLGLASAERTAESAYWASWVDTLPVLQSRFPTVASEVAASLQGTGPEVHSLAEAEQVRRKLIRVGATGIPTWVEAAAGAEAPQTAWMPGFIAAGNDIPFSNPPSKSRKS